MLLRKVLDDLAAAEARARTRDDPAGLESVARVRSQFQRAERLVFGKGASAACDQLADNPRRLLAALPAIFAPFPMCWVEFELDPGSGCQFGALWIAGKEGEGTGRQGNILFIFRDRDAESRESLHALFDLDDPNLHIAPSTKEQDRYEAASGMPFGNVAHFALHRFFYTVLAAWALLATKGMTGSVQPDLGKLNKARAAKGIYPLLSYREIRLNLDAERVAKARYAVGTGSMPWHMVRAHFRVLGTGRVTIVSSHPRGNAANGTRLHRYTVTRSGDHA